METLHKEHLDALISRAWSIRNQNFPPILNVSAPSAKTYITDHFRNAKNRFVNISVTGQGCKLNCEHCGGKLLDSMEAAASPHELTELGKALIQKGCKGVLISGGAREDGSVPLDNYMEAIRNLKDMGLQVIVHCGLASKETAEKLKGAGIDQVLMDVIGDAETIRQVYHLNKTPEDFENSLRIIRDANLAMAPHIVVGLHYGRILGEYNALRMISEVSPDVIVLVVLSPMHGTPMEGVVPPAKEEVAKLAAVARIVNPTAQITFGCARPAGSEKPELEKLLIKSGINAIAYPTDKAVEYAENLGLNIEFSEMCCSLLGM
ncbi:MAG: radical SAM protein [Thermoplasmata archaeon]|nr:MAG: radical SAM protein [Thermoplasmata archaeon]